MEVNCALLIYSALNLAGKKKWQGERDLRVVNGQIYKEKEFVIFYAPIYFLS